MRQASVREGGGNSVRCSALWTEVQKCVGASDDAQVDEELANGPALPIVVSLLDPRPGVTAPELPCPQDRMVGDLAGQTYAAAALGAMDLPLPPMGKFYSRAEIAYAAGLAVRAILSKALGMGGPVTCGVFHSCCRPP
jgi:hypothetical protein